MRKCLNTGIPILSALFVLYSCHGPQTTAVLTMPPPALPVVTITDRPFTTFRDYTATLEGSNDIEIRPQVSGYIEKIYVDEGAYVKKGQPIFKIYDQPFIESMNNANASLAVAKANQANAEINVNKLDPLVKNNVVSPIQL